MIYEIINKVYGVVLMKHIDFMPKFQWLSRFRRVEVANKMILKLNPISALHFVIQTRWHPKKLKIKVNGTLVYEQVVLKDKDAKTLYQYYFNVWLNFSKYIDQCFKLEIYSKHFFFYYRIYQTQCTVIKNQSHALLSLSNADLPEDMLALSDPAALEARISQLPSKIYHTGHRDLSNSIQSILLLRLDQLGDLVLTIPSIIRIKDLCPDAKLSIMVAPHNASLVKSLGFFSEVYSLNFNPPNEFKHEKNLRQILAEKFEEMLQGQSFDLVIDLSPMPDSRYLVSRVDAIYKMGFINCGTHDVDAGINIYASDLYYDTTNISHLSYPAIMVDMLREILKPKVDFLDLKEHIIESWVNDLGLRVKKYIVIHSGS